jgi:serine/threonine protein kinase
MIEEIEKIGEGSFGRVYKAYDTSDNTVCAVKVLKFQIVFKVIPKSFIKDSNLE